jgi:hypothetical protein
MRTAVRLIATSARLVWQEDVMKSFGTVLLCLAVAGPCLGSDAKTYELRRQPKVGDSATYVVNASFDYSGKTAAMSMRQVETITKVDGDSFEVETKASDCRMKSSDGKEEAVPEDKPSCTVYDRLGALLTIHEASPDGTAYRKANMLSFVAPARAVHEGDQWTREFKADVASGMRDAKSTFCVEKAEKLGSFGTVNIRFSFAEATGTDAISSEGHLWVNQQDGSIVKIEAKFKNLPMGEAGVPVDGSFSMTREG